MITTIPDNWEYNDSLEMMFLFYQRADELLSETTADTFSLPLHNTITLLIELDSVHSLLKTYGLVEEYYSKYIPPIIDEFICQTEEDYIFKQLIGERLDSIRTGLNEAKKSPVHLQAWIDVVKHICTPGQYIDAYENEITRLIKHTKDKNKMLYCIANYFVSLRHVGYSREHLYFQTKNYFGNRTINSSEQIKSFFSLFPCTTMEYEFLILMDIDSIEYMDSISDQLALSKQIKRVDVSKERETLSKNRVVKKMLDEYDSRIKKPNTHEKPAIVRFLDKALDPYSAITSFSNYIEVLQTFARYFKHFYFAKQLYKVLIKKSNSYSELKLPKKLQKRPFIQQSIIDRRIQCVLKANSMEMEAFQSIVRAITMHAEAFDTRNTAALLRTFWTALETLFSSPNPNSTRDNVINSVIPIIQKTYILKTLRALYAQLNETITKDDLNEIGISDFRSFAEYYSSFAADSQEMKILYNKLGSNTLLRTRLYSYRKKLACGNEITEMLEKHKNRIEWQLKRLYRIRNISTHIGLEMPETEVAVNHLHNYFDFVLNYMLCKSESGDHIVSTSAVVFEAKNDLRIYMERLKNNDQLCKENYLNLLFGPDYRLIDYEFEH